MLIRPDEIPNHGCLTAALYCIRGLIPHKSIKTSTTCRFNSRRRVATRQDNGARRVREMARTSSSRRRSWRRSGERRRRGSLSCPLSTSRRARRRVWPTCTIALAAWPRNSRSSWTSPGVRLARDTCYVAARRTGRAQRVRPVSRTMTGGGHQGDAMRERGGVHAGCIRSYRCVSNSPVLYGSELRPPDGDEARRLPPSRPTE